jgi:dihydrofolate synthase/folylpolyglutamate synthase
VHEGATVVLASQPPEAAEVLLRRCAEVGATVAREGLEFGVVERRTAVGGQLLDLQGLAGRYEDVFLPAARRPPGANAAAALAAAESFLSAVRPRSTPTSCARVRRRPSPGRLEVARTSPDRAAGRRAQPRRA